MDYRALATDYDGTLATKGAVDLATWEAVDRLKASGRLAVLVTGRELGELRVVCPRLRLFDRVVAENGALLHRPSDGSESSLGPAPPKELVAGLRRRGVAPISVGRGIVAAWEPHREAIEATIRELGIPWRVIPNKRALMVLPEGVDKASGLLAALAELGVDPAEAVGVGDAENDRPLLDVCGLGVAVANALPGLKEGADLVTIGERGDGVAEVIDRMIAGSCPPAQERYGHAIRVRSVPRDGEPSIEEEANEP